MSQCSSYGLWLLLWLGLLIFITFIPCTVILFILHVSGKECSVQRTYVRILRCAVYRRAESATVSKYQNDRSFPLKAKHVRRRNSTHTEPEPSTSGRQWCNCAFIRSRCRMNIKHRPIQFLFSLEKVTTRTLFCLKVDRSSTKICITSTYCSASLGVFHTATVDIH